MSKFVNEKTGVVFSVDDSKDDRYAQGHKPYKGEPKAPAKRAPSSKSEK